MSFPRYPRYKQSGVEWLGEVPEHWNVVPIKRAFRIIGGSTPKSDVEAFWDGTIQWATPADLSGLCSMYLAETQRKITDEGLESCGTSLVPKNSIILSTRAPIGSLAIAAGPMCTNQGCKSLVPRNGMDVGYYAQLLSVSSTELNIRGKGTTFLELSADALGAFVVPLPPSPEQDVIASFLDRETAKIDELVAEQRRLIELLKEKRQAVISHAVTKGLNPHAPMKPSGIEWLGDVPKYWEVVRVKHLVRSIEQGWSPQCEGFPVETEDEWGVLKVGCVNGGAFNATENKVLPPDLEPIPSLGISSGDLLISRANTRELVGGAAVAAKDYPKLLLCDKLYRLRLKPERASPMFLALYLGSGAARGPIELGATGASASMVNIGQSVILELDVAVPPIEEQRSIVASLGREATKLESLTAEAARTIDLLQERRTALISAAVTGKIDVREFAASEAR
jgi:type I restriction enzyme S subunit